MTFITFTAGEIQDSLLSAIASLKPQKEDLFEFMSSKKSEELISSENGLTNEAACRFILFGKIPISNEYKCAICTRLIRFYSCYENYNREQIIPLEVSRRYYSTPLNYALLGASF